MKNTIILLQVMKERLTEQKSIGSVDMSIIDQAIKELKALDIIKKNGIKLIIPNNDLSNEHIDIQIFTNTLSKDELELIKKELKL